jgi:hypothetical protein
MESQLISVVQLYNDHQSMFKDIRISKLEEVPAVGTGAGRRVQLVRCRDCSVVMFTDLVLPTFAFRSQFRNYSFNPHLKF